MENGLGTSDYSTAVWPLRLPYNNRAYVPLF